MSEQIEVKGTDARVTFDGNAVRIRRSWTSKQGRGERSIHVSQLAGVEIRPATVMNRMGAIVFVVPGAHRARRAWSGKRDERRDESTVQFIGGKRQRQFEALRDAILAAM